MIWRIAFKNVWRNKVRSLVVICSILLGLSGGIVTTSIITGMVEQKVRTGLNNEVSHIQIHRPGFLTNYDIRLSIPGADSLAAAIARMPLVQGVSARVRVTGLAASAHSVSGIQLTGVDPEQEKQVSTLYRTIPDTAGGYFTGTRRNQAVIGRELADKLKLRVKSKIVIRFQDVDGNLAEAAFSVTGIYQTANTTFDQMNIFVRKSDLYRLAGDSTGVQEIAIWLKNIEDIPKVQPELQKRLPGLTVQNWTELRPDMAIVTTAISIEVYVILAIILFALAFGIVNTMLMIVLERTRELGMLMAVGMSKARVFRMIMLETVFLTAIGGLAGMALSAVLVSLFHHTGIDLSSFSKGLGAFGFDPKIYPFITLKLYLYLSVMILVTGILSAILPARTALRLNPVEAIHTE